MELDARLLRRCCLNSSAVPHLPKAFTGCVRSFWRADRSHARHIADRAWCARPFRLSPIRRSQLVPISANKAAAPKTRAYAVSGPLIAFSANPGANRRHSKVTRLWQQEFRDI